MAKYYGIEFAPLNVPFERRMQTLMVMIFVSAFTVLPVVISLACIALLFTPYYGVTLAYAMWIGYDVYIQKVSSRGGRGRVWFRQARIWTYFRDYFPCELLKTHELDPKRNYIMGYHPHGIIGCGALINFGTEATGFSRKFAGIKPHLTTLKLNFLTPVTRGLYLFSGLCDVTKESIRWLMTKQGQGNAAIILVGGAEESLHAMPGVYTLILKRRKGFVRMAIKTGADLVPVYSFGETDIYTQVENPEGSLLRQAQDAMKRILGFTLPVFHGRGTFNYTFGMLPFRKPISTVVGRPIEVVQSEELTEELVDEYHAKYLKALSDLFDEHKEKYGIDKKSRLEFV